MWYALHSTFNTASNHQVDIDILNEITDKPTVPWLVFSKEEFRTAISSCNNSSAPSSDKLLWSHLKIILKDNKCLNTIIHIANACINLGYWPSHFKISTTVVIPKPNKKLYDSSKLFRPIVLLNTVGKLIEKVIGERLQFNTVSNDFIHLSQLGGLKFKSTTDAASHSNPHYSSWVSKEFIHQYPCFQYRSIFSIVKSLTPLSYHEESWFWLSYCFLFYQLPSGQEN